MKKTNNATEAPNTSWIKKLKVAIAAFAFVAAGVFGASVADVPQPQSEETAGSNFDAWYSGSWNFGNDSDAPDNDSEPDQGEPKEVTGTTALPKNPFPGGGHTSMATGTWS